MGRFAVTDPRDPRKVCAVEATARGVIVTASKRGGWLVVEVGSAPPLAPYLVPHHLPDRPKLPRKENIILDDTLD